VVVGAPRYRRGMLDQDLATYTALMEKHGSFGQTLSLPRGDRPADYATACGLIAAYPDTFEAGHLTVVRDWIAEARRLEPDPLPPRPAGAVPGEPRH
jgi:hypothetical protein